MITESGTKMIQEFLNKLEEIVNIDSGSFCPAGIAAVADVIAGWFAALGWQVTRHDLGGETGPLLEITNRGTEKYDAVLLGHMDTVFAEGTAAERPFRVEGDLAFGPGVVDMKGGLVVRYFVAKALSALGEQAPAVCMLFDPDEEIGARYSAAKMIEVAAKGSRLYVLEGTGCDGVHCHARKGIRAFDIEFHGESAHAGNLLEMPGASAILEAARWTEIICGLVDREKEITANVGTIRGGLARNVVPDFAMLRAEIRAFRPEDIDAAANRLQQLAAAPMTPGVAVELKAAGGRPPLVPGDATWAEIGRAKAIAETLGQTFHVQAYGGVSDANTICGALPHLVCLDDMGPSGSGEHSPEESLRIDSVVPCVELLTALLTARAAGL